MLRRKKGTRAEAKVVIKRPKLIVRILRSKRVVEIAIKQRVRDRNRLTRKGRYLGADLRKSS